MLKRWRIATRLCAWVFTLFVIPLSVEAKNIDEMMTYAQFENLMKHKTSQISDLKMVWDWTTKNRVAGVYAGGGRLRGLLWWVHQQLQTRSYNEVWNLPVPTYEQLAITTNEGVDRDLYTTDQLQAAVKNWLPSFDVLNQSFYAATLQNGGSTLDKIRISPTEVSDPAGGLMDFFHGQLVFKWSEQMNSSQLPGDKHINLAIRYLRFSVDFKNILTPTTESLAHLANIPRLDGKYVPDNPYHPNYFPAVWQNNINNAQRTAYRIGKAMKKLYYATQKNLVQTLLVLKSAGLLDLMIEKRYYIPNYNWSNLNTFVASLRKAGFTPVELRGIGRMFLYEVPSTIAYKRDLVLGAEAAEDFLTLIAYGISPSDAYKTAIADLINEPKVVARFFQLTPSADQVNRLKQYLPTVESIMAFNRQAISHVKSYAAYSAVMKLSRADASPAYKASLAKLIADDAKNLAEKWNPSEAEYTEFAQRNILDASTRDLFFRRVRLWGTRDPEVYVRTLATFSPPDVSYFTRFMGMKPTTEQMRLYRDTFASQSKDADLHLALMQRFAVRSANLKEFLVDTAYPLQGDAKQAEAYESSMRTLFNEQRVKYFTSPTEIEEALKVATDIQRRVIEATLPRMLNSSLSLQVVEQLASLIQDSGRLKEFYRQAILKTTQAEDFLSLASAAQNRVSLDPDPATIKTFLELRPEIDQINRLSTLWSAQPKLRNQLLSAVYSQPEAAFPSLRGIQNPAVWKRNLRLNSDMCGYYFRGLLGLSPSVAH